MPDLPLVLFTQPSNWGLKGRRTGTQILPTLLKKGKRIFPNIKNHPTSSWWFQPTQIGSFPSIFGVKIKNV